MCVYPLLMNGWGKGGTHCGDWLASLAELLDGNFTPHLSHLRRERHLFAIYLLLLSILFLQ